MSIALRCRGPNRGSAAGLSSWGIGLNIVFGPILQLFDLASAFPEDRVPLFGPML
jgi:hypothetical protein